MGTSFCCLRVMEGEDTYGAVVIGGTGAVGEWVVRFLLRSDKCSHVLSLVRTPADFSDEVDSRLKKLEQKIIDFDALSSVVVPASTKLAFCCIGTREPSKHSKDEFVHVDVGYPERFAKTCKDTGVSHFSLISSVNASSSSLSRFGRTKFKAEVAVKDVGFAKTSIFRPSVLKTPGARYGLKDQMFQSTAPKVTGLLSTKYKEVRVEDLARAMVINAELNANRKGEEVLEWEDFQRIWALERYDFDRNRNEELGSDH